MSVADNDRTRNEMHFMSVQTTTKREHPMVVDYSAETRGNSAFSAPLTQKEFTMAVLDSNLNGFVVNIFLIVFRAAFLRERKEMSCQISQCSGGG